MSEEDPDTPGKRDRATKKEMDARRGVVAGLLNERRGQEIPFDDILDHLSNRKLRASPRILQRIAEEIRAGLEAEMELRVSRSSMCLTAAADSVYASRKRDNPEVKELLARAAWYHLFGYGPALSPLEAELLPATVPGASYSILSKIAALNERTEVALVIDAGTTTGEFGSYMLAAERFPLETHVSDPRLKDPRKRAATGRTRFLIPRILSNSQPFSDQVYRCDHADMFEFMLIGGTLRPKHGSYCGPLSMMTLKSWDGMGCDVAVIGSTGFRGMDQRGSAGFSCANFYESQMKAALIKKAWLRTVICDSSKLERPNAANLFAPLAAKELDLVITDDGSLTNVARKLVDDFVKAARAAGVAVLLVKKAMSTHHHQAPAARKP